MRRRATWVLVAALLGSVGVVGVGLADESARDAERSPVVRVRPPGTSAPGAPGESLLRGFGLDPVWAPGRDRPAPPDHGSDWLATHGARAATLGGGSDEAACASCHTEDSCASCHAGDAVAAAVHPAGYLVLHGPDAAMDTGDCARCHAPSRFCRSCHLEVELTSAIDDRPPAFVEAHPPGWLDAGGHGPAARRDLMACVSCHAEQDCVQCHAYVSPHDASFVDRCGAMLRAAEPTCATCHGATSSLPLERLRALPSCGGR